jgi:hypothetical protein
VSFHVTANPSAELPGSVIGKPIRLPYFMLCVQGCGKRWTANTGHDLVLKLAERRDHETACKGGLIRAGGA